MALGDFPRFFEAQYSQYTEDLPFWLELAQESHGPVLELGCGYGRVLLPIASAGIPAVGIDHDPGMLLRASDHLSPDLSPLVSLHRADLRDFNLGQLFPLVISPCNTFAILSDGDFRKAASCAARHLTTGGRLVLDLPPESQDEAPITEASELCGAFDDLDSGHPVQVSAREQADPEGGRALVTWLYDELLPDGRVERTEIPMTYYLRSEAALCQLLMSAGFKVIEVFGDFQRRAYDRGSTRIIVSASLGASVSPAAVDRGDA